MQPDSPVKNLFREDVSLSAPFTVSELPHKAKLDQNEAPFDLPNDIKMALLDKLLEYQWNRYPQPSVYMEVKEAFAKSIGYAPENIIITIGADQLIQAAYLIAGGHDRKALIFEPTYPMFAHAAKFNQTNVDRTQLAAGETVTKDHINAADHNIIFIVAPNNPTGLMPEEGAIEAALAKNSLVFVDESYFDYSKKTWAHLLKDNPNLFIARSASKSCLAGIRLGYGIGHPDVISAMESTLTAPYHLSYLQLTVAKYFNFIQSHLKNLAVTIIFERDRITNQLKGMGVPYIPSQGNFVLFKVANPSDVYRKLAESGVRVRSLHSIPGLSDYVRVTVGKDKENDLFIKQLKGILAS